MSKSTTLLWLVVVDVSKNNTWDNWLDWIFQQPWIGAPANITYVIYNSTANTTTDYTVNNNINSRSIFHQSLLQVGKQIRGRSDLLSPPYLDCLDQCFTPIFLVEFAICIVEFCADYLPSFLQSTSIFFTLFTPWLFLQLVNLIF